MSRLLSACVCVGWKEVKEAHLGSIGNVLALLYFQLIVHLLPVVGHGENAVGAIESVLEGALVVDITLDQVNTTC